MCSLLRLYTQLRRDEEITDLLFLNFSIRGLCVQSGKGIDANLQSHRNMCTDVTMHRRYDAPANQYNPLEV